MKVGTKYINSAKKFFKEKDLKVEIIKLNGSVELAPKIGLTDFIVDLTATGTTLKENGLKIIETIFSSTARLISNPAKTILKYNEIISISKKIKNQCNH